MTYKSVGRNIWKQTYGIQRFLLFVLLLTLACLVFVQVILRYVLHAPLMGIEEMLIFPSVWLYFIGSATASQERSQIQARALDLFLRKPKSLYLGETIKSALAFGIAVWLTYWAYDYFLWALGAGKISSSLYWPLIYAEAALFFGFLLIAVYSLVELVDYITKLSHEIRQG